MKELDKRDSDCETGAVIRDDTISALADMCDPQTQVNAMVETEAPVTFQLHDSDDVDRLDSGNAQVSLQNSICLRPCAKHSGQNKNKESRAVVVQARIHPIPSVTHRSVPRETKSAGLRFASRDPDDSCFGDEFENLFKRL
jgi:hypothetical protein